MPRLRRTHPSAVVIALFALAVVASARAGELDQQLRSKYQGKVFLLRGFYSSDKLHYDSSGQPENANSGSWTVDGFVCVNDIHFSGDRLFIKGQRMVVVWLDRKEFELRPKLRGTPGRSVSETVQVEIKADSGMHNASAEQVDAFASRIFLTSQDSLADLIPDYWKPCVTGGLRGTDKNCAFAAEIVAIPGIAPSNANDASTAPVTDGDLNGAPAMAGSFRKDMSPPRLTYHQEPEFSESARAAKFQGTVVLKLVVNKEGAPTKIRISQPLGYGLDEKAVQAVSEWKFKPAEKDNQPVNTEIAVEVEFHLY
jgi:TonB family protein